MILIIFKSTSVTATYLIIVIIIIIHIIASELCLKFLARENSILSFLNLASDKSILGSWTKVLC